MTHKTAFDIEGELWALWETGDLDDEDDLTLGVDDDEISAAEEGFIRGYQRETARLFQGRPQGEI